MKDVCTRRDFIKGGAMGAGLLLIGTLSSTVLAGEKGKKVVFRSVKKGKKGCSRCEKAIAAMLKDRKMKAELIELMPDNSTVYFYVRKFTSSTKVPDNAIIVGGCAKTLKSKGELFIPGCTKQIKPKYVFDYIVKHYSEKK